MDKLELYYAIMDMVEPLDEVGRQAVFAVVLHRLEGNTMEESYQAGNKILVSHGLEPVPYPVPVQ